VSFLDFPDRACVSLGSPILLFAFEVTNEDSTGYPALGLVIAADRFEGGVGPEGLLAAKLEREDIINERWITDTGPLSADQQSWLSAHIPTTALGGRARMSATYRLTLTGVGGHGGTTFLHGFVIDERLHKVLAEATVALCVQI
jgi:hypothetical protein